MLKRFLNKQTNTISKAAYILAASSIISALLGLFRDRLLASHFGASANLDIYYTAFRIPNFVFGVLISGGIIAAFMPIFAKTYSQNKEQGWALTNNVLNVFSLLMAVLCLALVVLAPWVVKLIAPGFSPANQQQTATLTRIMLLSPFFFALSNILSAVLQHFNLFFVFALSPILYNLGIIFGILFFVKKFGLLGLAFGIVLGAVLHFLVQVPSIFQVGFKYKPIFDLKSKSLKRIFYLMIPRTFSAAVSHINLIVITAIASTLEQGSISIFNFAEHLRGIPIGIIGSSFAVAAYPFLTKSIAKGDKQEFANSFLLAFKQTLFYIMPLSFLLFIFKNPIAQVVLQVGAFSATATQQTATVLGLFAFSVFAFALMPLFARAFFAFKNTKTPFFISLISVLLNISLSFILVYLFRLYLINPLFALPLAFSISGIIQLCLLCFFLLKKTGNFGLKPALSYAVRVLLNCCLMALTLLPLFLLNIESFPLVVLGGSLGLLLYLAFSKVFKTLQF